MKYRIGILIAVFVLGFFIGRGNIRTVEKVEYVKGKEITNTVKIPQPYLLKVPQVYFLPMVNGVVDTAQIISDYILERRYEINVFDNDAGKLDVEQSIQYNELKEFNYTFTPIQKVITKRTKPLFEPFVSVGYNTYQQASVGGGLFYRNVGVEYNYLYSADYNSGHQLGIKVKF